MFSAKLRATALSLSVCLSGVLLGERRRDLLPQFVLLLLLRERLHRAKAVHDVARLAEVDLVERVPAGKNRADVKVHSRATN